MVYSGCTVTLVLRKPFRKIITLIKVPREPSRIEGLGAVGSMTKYIEHARAPSIAPRGVLSQGCGPFGRQCKKGKLVNKAKSLSP